MYRRKRAKKNNAATVLRTDRCTNVPPPPSVMPFDFAIDSEWYAREKYNYLSQTNNYFSWGDPAGFGSRRIVHEGS